MPPIETSKSSVRIKTMLGLGYIVEATRLLQCKVTQMRIKRNMMNEKDVVCDAELKTSNAITKTGIFSCDKRMKRR